MTAMLPPQADTVYSREGTRAHALAQHCLETKSRKAAKFVGAPVPGLDEDLTKVNEDMAKAVQVYLDTVFGLLDANDGAQLFIEQKFKLPFIGPDIDGSDPGGTNDACIFYPATRFIDVIDYKHGAGKFVDVRNNKQLKYYALGAQRHLALQGLRISGARMTIVQPRCTASDEPVRSVSISLAELFDYKEELVVAAGECRKPDAPCTPGPWCKGTWCVGALQLACEAFKDAALKGLVEAPRGLPGASANGAVIPAVDVAPAKPTAVAVTVPDPKHLTPDELATRLRQAPFLAAYLKCLEDYAYNEAKAGRMPPGFKWVLGRGSRQWTAAESEVLKALQRQTNAPFEKRTLVTVPQAEEIIGKAKFSKIEELKPLWTKKPGAPKLVPAEHPGEPYSGVIELEPVEIGD